MKVLIVCHAGIGIGLGHLTRSMVIAKALRAKFGADVRLLIQGDSLERDDLKVFPHRFVSLNDDLVEQIFAQVPVDLVLFDFQPQLIPQALSLLIRSLRVMGTKIVAIDGLLAYRPELDLIFIPSFQFKPPSDLQDGAPIVYGWDCLLLDPQWVSVPWAPGHRVLILTGGSDATRLGNTWPAQLDQALPDDIELNWVTGPFSMRPVWPGASHNRMIEHMAPTGLGNIMQRVHYAVTVFGVSFFELLYLGVPTVVFSPYGSKDAAELAAIAEAGVALVAANELEATERLKTLLQDYDLARQLSNRARDTLGRSGVERLYTEISAWITH